MQPVALVLDLGCDADEVTPAVVVDDLRAVRVEPEAAHDAEACEASEAPRRTFFPFVHDLGGVHLAGVVALERNEELVGAD